MPQHATQSRAITRDQSVAREGYSPAEFAAAFGKSSTWAYRLIWGHKVKAVDQFGRLIIPRSEMERLTATAEPYDPKPKKIKGEQSAGKQEAISAAS